MKSAATGLLVATLLLLTVPASAQEGPSFGGDQDTIVIGDEYIREGLEPRRRPSGPAGPTAPTHLVVVLRNDGGGVCIDTARRPGEDNAARQMEFEMQAMRLAGTYSWCPDVVPPTISPAAAAAIVWQELVELDKPTVRIQPGKAVTGKPAYLEIGNPQTGSWHFELYGFSIDLAATSTYDIDWGDGTWTRGATTQGGPWPDGTLTHTYTDTGTLTVTVHQRWSATYSINGVTGAVPGTLQTVGELADFPVVEIEAVRNR